MQGYRSNDAVITICQNNRAKSIEIREANKVAEDLLRYRNADLAGKSLTEILPPRIGEMLKEYVEFDSDIRDVGSVLTRVQSFSVVGKDGKETAYRLKVVRDESTADEIMFKLVLQDKLGLRKDEALHEAIREHFKGHEALDPDTGLPDCASLTKDIEVLGRYVVKNNLRSCFAAIQVDHYDALFSQYGRTVCQALIKHVAFVCRQNLRPDDVVGSVSYKRVGVLLLDTSPESGRVVFNRLRWQIAANPFLLPDKTTVGLSVSIALSRVGGGLSDKTIIDDCVRTLEAAGESAVNLLTEVEETAKRKAE